MFRSRTVSAIAALVGLLLPWAQVAGVSAHLVSAHHQEESHDTADLEDSFHGHHHEPGHPRHQHSLIGCDLVLQRSRAIAAVLVADSALGRALLAIIPAMRTRIAAPWEALSDHGPPRAPRRAVLRI
jgi:hypothetical protein